MTILSSVYPISFILPIYNAEPYLAKAIESILRQKIEKEIILVDDGSTDNSFDIAKEYAQRYSFIQVIHSKNEGVSTARNRGLALSRGEYVLFLDPDDVIDGNVNFNDIYQMAVQHGCNAVKGQFINLFLQNGEVATHQSTHPDVQGNQAKILALHDFFLYALSRGWFIQIGCFLIERAFLQKNHLMFNPNISFGEDGLFQIELYCKEGIILEFPSVFIHYQIHDQSVMSAAISEKRIYSTLENIRILEEKCSQYQGNPLHNTLEAALAMYYYFLQRDISATTDKKLKQKYQESITPEMLILCEKYNIRKRDLTH